MSIITTTTASNDREGTEMTTEVKAPGTVFLRVPQAARGEYEWVRERTVRLLPEVAAMIERRIALPATLEIVLTTRRQMARELAANEVGEASGVLGKLRMARAARTWRGLEAALWDWPSRKQDDGRQVVIYLDVDTASRTGELEWGALLAEQVMLASLTAAPRRSRHLGQVDELVGTAQQPGARKDLLFARRGLEFAAGQAAAEAWRTRRSRLAAVLSRADDVLELLDAEAVDRPAVVIRSHYTEREPTAGTITDVHDLITWDNARRTEWYPSGLPIEAERARRLRAAAFGDLIALQAEVEGSAEEQAALANTAAHLGLDLRDFDAAHGTGRGWRGPQDLYWEASGLARSYTRQEWLAADDVDQDDEAED